MPGNLEFSSEIIIDLPPREMVARTRAMLRTKGWREGLSTETPNRGQLVVAGRERSRSYLLRSALPFWEHGWAEAIASDYSGRVAIVNERDFTEWTDGKETIYLDPERNGEFRGVEWYDIEEGNAAPEDLPGTFVAALEQADSPDDLTDRLATALHGEARPRADTALDFYRPYDATLEKQLAPLFVAIRKAALQRQTVDIPGFATFRRRDLADVVVPTEDGAAFERCFSGRAAPRVTLDKNLLPGASPQQLAALESELQSVCSRIRDGRKDLLLGAGLAIGSRELLGYDGRNPRTGEVVKVPPRRIPYFVGW